MSFDGDAQLGGQKKGREGGREEERERNRQRDRERKSERAPVMYLIFSAPFDHPHDFLACIDGIHIASLTVLMVRREQVHAVAEVQPNTPVGETALLTLGALLRNRRTCGDQVSVESEYLEHHLNNQLQLALHVGDTEQADIVLLAMHNSASGHHLHTIQKCMYTHQRVMRSLDLKHATTMALSGIGQHADAQDLHLQQLLLTQLERPPQGVIAGRKSNLAAAPKMRRLLPAAHSKALQIGQRMSALKRFQVKASDDSEEEEEDDVDPRKCLGGEEPLVCYGKRIPQEGTVRALIGLFGGVAEAFDRGAKCQVRASNTSE